MYSTSNDYFLKVAQICQGFTRYFANRNLIPAFIAKVLRRDLWTLEDHSPLTLKSTTKKKKWYNPVSFTYIELKCNEVVAESHTQHTQVTSCSAAWKCAWRVDSNGSNPIVSQHKIILVQSSIISKQCALFEGRLSLEFPLCTILSCSPPNWKSG